MRRLAAGITATFVAVVVVAGPLASTGQAAPTALRCATATPAPACALLDQLTAQLAPVAGLLPAPLAGLVTPAQGFAARADQPAGVPTAEVVQVSQGLLAQLAGLPDPVKGLLGPTALGAITGTLSALVDELTAPVTGGQAAAGASKPTPAKTAPPAKPAPAPRATEAPTLGGSVAGPSAGGAPSSASVPDVPVGQPLALAPLGMPDFRLSETMAPVAVNEVAPAAAPITDADVALADAVSSLPDRGRGVELAVLVILSLLLIAGAGIAQVQQNRHTIPS